MPGVTPAEIRGDDKLLDRKKQPEEIYSDEKYDDAYGNIIRTVAHGLDAIGRD